MHYSAKRLVLLGAPGVGKGTQAALLHERLGACHLSTGDIFRSAGSRPESAQTPAIREALAYIRRGELVPDATVLEMVRERKVCLHCRGGFILDGFPRTVGQAESLKKLMLDRGCPSLQSSITICPPTKSCNASVGGALVHNAKPSTTSRSGLPKWRTGVISATGPSFSAKMIARKPSASG